MIRILTLSQGAQSLSGIVLDSRSRGRGFEPHWRHCVVSLSKNINPSLVLIQPRKTRIFILERLLMVRKESYQTNKYLTISGVRSIGIYISYNFIVVKYSRPHWIFLFITNDRSFRIIKVIWNR